MKGQPLSVRQSWAGCTLPAMLSRLTDWHSPCGLAAVCMGGVVDVRFRRRIWTLYQVAWFVVQTNIVITLCEENGFSGFLLFSSLPLPPPLLPPLPSWTVKRLLFSRGLQQRAYLSARPDPRSHA
ncbi:uncharacterized protein BO72DRAFT_453586 [Aspergillus fijiensis CBS 313.89]|uniref:Uncharacterized protein n=1 Tax=Aspergillus fijiensis CBS 313.89 TaxID=1448319 RepID=A0A8G1RFV1_9EURO|nr:uncharacterized protein BO72DRAFT_453586 [Aspergillus fijiensis CBS 313.89]RAK71562.1 hypothetical protein BO72DRAFT_453586 [Aspergillus fijiensis CBS 313.89]